MLAPGRGKIRAPIPFTKSEYPTHPAHGPDSLPFIFIVVGKGVDLLVLGIILIVIQV